MTIEKAGLQKLDAVRKITQETISAIYPKYYPYGAVEYFKLHHSDENILSDISEGLVYILYNDSLAAGTVTIKENHIQRLFVLPEFQGKGLGRALLDFSESEINKNYSEVLIDSSFPAKHLYLKRGYREIDFCSIETPGGDFLCYDVMSKKL